MMTAGALVVVAPVSTGVAPASTAQVEDVSHESGPQQIAVSRVRPVPVRSVT